ncbi:MAG: DUF4328 domain-containing protein [Myxococcota bacterium]
MDAVKVRRLLGIVSALLLAVHAAWAARLCGPIVRLIRALDGSLELASVEAERLVAQADEGLQLLSWLTLATAAAFVPFFTQVSAASSPQRPPSWAVWSWFVPIANFFLPYRLAQEVEVHHGRSAQGWMLFGWWTLWLVSRFTQLGAWVQGNEPGALHYDVASLVTSVPSAALAAALCLRWLSPKKRGE